RSHLARVCINCIREFSTRWHNSREIQRCDPIFGIKRHRGVQDQRSWIWLDQRSDAGTPSRLEKMIPELDSRTFALSRCTLIISGLLTLGTLLALSQSKSHTAARKTGPQRILSVAQWNNFGVAYMDQQRLDEAIKAFESAHALNPKALIPELNRSI